MVYWAPDPDTIPHGQMQRWFYKVNPEHPALWNKSPAQALDAWIFAGDSGVYTFSVHGERNYPFHKIPGTLDVDDPAPLHPGVDVGHPGQLDLRPLPAGRGQE